MQLISTAILAKVEPQRLLKATEGLVSGAYSITLAEQSESEIRGFVANGDKTEYSVVLTVERAFCSCKDSMWRHSTCKHATALALYALRTPLTPEHAEDYPPSASLKLTKTRPGWVFPA